MLFAGVLCRWYKLVFYSDCVLDYAGVEDVNMVTGDELNAPDVYLIFLNGLIVGAHPRPHVLVHKVRH